MRDDATDDNVDASEIKHSSEGFVGSFVEIGCGPSAVRCRTLPRNESIAFLFVLLFNKNLNILNQD